MKIALLGDMALFGHNTAERGLYHEKFKEVKEELAQFDYIIANLETPLTRITKTVGGKSAYIKGSPDDIEILKHLGVTHVTLANNHICDFLQAGADETIKYLEAADIEWLLDKYQNDGYSDSYVRKMRGMLYQIFNKAEANDLIRKNPVRFAEKIRSKNTPPPKEAFTAFEVKLLMENLPDDRMGNSIRLLLCTGMRSQELLALEPRHIAKDGSYIYILQAVNLVKGTVKIGPPKSKDSIRNIPIPENYRDCAMALRDTNKKFIWEVGKPGMPCNPTYFRDKFREYLAMVDGVRILTPHSCRHTYVSQLQALGIDVPTIQSLCGHAEVDMTQHYLHVQENVRLAAVERFGKEFGRASEPDENSNIVALTGSSTEQLNKDDYLIDNSDPIRAGLGRIKNGAIIKFPKSY